MDKNNLEDLTGKRYLEMVLVVFVWNMGQSFLMLDCSLILC